MRKNGVILLFLCLIIMSVLSCTKKTSEKEADLAETIAFLSKTLSQAEGRELPSNTSNILTNVLRMAEIPEPLSAKIFSTAIENPAFILELLMCLEADSYLRKFVDKQHALEASYEPEDLVDLGKGDTAKSYLLNRTPLYLRKAAAIALEEMAAAAKADGITLVVSSAYRSYAYQDEVYKRNVRQMGQEAADRESARPGHSQHQTGLAADFGSIDDSFAETAQGRWMAKNASRFGWSLSYPQGLEHITGYRWESWHYRYLGKDMTQFIERYFDGIQQYGLRFLHEWESVVREQ